MTTESYSVPDASRLLEQFENILDHDPLIAVHIKCSHGELFNGTGITVTGNSGWEICNEIGFVHPSQFVVLNEEEGEDSVDPTVIGLQSPDHTQSASILDKYTVQFDHTVFWNRNHKLAISFLDLPILYKAAKHAYVVASRRYNVVIDLPESMGSYEGETMPKGSSDLDNFRSGILDPNLLEKEVMRHSKALLILSCDFQSAWNFRKQVVSRKHSFSFYLIELQLSALVLSYSPKCEHAWVHRRWVIKTISGKFQELQEILRKESQLVEQIAEKSKMNYRAWHHRGWLVSFMTIGQMLEELNQSRKWAELHVADNCCFHYRRRLMLMMLEENNCLKLDMDPSFDNDFDLYIAWKKELDWNQIMIQRFIGREALWVHRRFLSQGWIKNITTTQLENLSEINRDLDIFLDNELMLLRSCLNFSDNEFEDARAQAEYAASYTLWISKGHNSFNMGFKLWPAVDRLWVLKGDQMIIWLRRTSFKDNE